MNMRPPNYLAIGFLICGLIQTYSATDVRALSKADQLRATERQRLRALVDADMTTASRLHADDFQLINPRGGALSKEQYLRDVASGDLNYLEWEPGEMRVRLYGNAAVIRYQARLIVSVKGSPGRPVTFWHTDLYEKRNGQWQIVWAHATQLNDGTSSTDEATIRKLDDEKQIADIFKKWEAAWNTHDMSAYASLYHDDGVWSSGPETFGKENRLSKKATLPSIRPFSAIAPTAFRIPSVLLNSANAPRFEMRRKPEGGTG
jgi:ketosteroid isomerase-like protein